MKGHDLFIRVATVSFLLSLLLITGGCFHPQLTSLAAASQERQIITVEVEELILNYSEELFWTKEQFDQEYREFLADKAGYLGDIEEDLLRQWSEYGIETTDWSVSFITEYEETGKAAYSTLVRCEVHNAISKSGDSYYARFEWLLRPLGLDFIDDGFEESTDGLSWEGTINGLPTTIIVKLPPRDSVYEAWHHPNGHCHAHAWWAEEG